MQQIVLLFVKNLSGKILFLCFSILPLFGWAQLNKKIPVEKKGIIYNKEISFGVNITTNGWNILVEKGKIKSIRKTRIMHFSFGEMRDEKSKKQNADLGFFGNAVNSPKDFFFGRRNNFYVLRYGLGQKRVIAQKAEKNGVRFSYIYHAGASLGLLKPYYLKLAFLIDNTNPNFDVFELRNEKFSDENADVFTDWFSIAGASGFRHGIDEIDVIPGGYGRFGLNFDWSKNEEMMLSLEVGITADVYYKKVKLMVDNRNNDPFFIGAYLQFQYGRRRY